MKPPPSTSTFTYALNGRDVFLRRLQQDPQIDSVIVADIDQMRQHNDVHGMPAGNELLDRLWNFLVERSALADGFRVGGDQFVIVRRSGTAAAAQEFAEKIREEFRELRIPGSLWIQGKEHPRIVTIHVASVFLAADPVARSPQGILDDLLGCLQRAKSVKTHRSSSGP